MANPFLQASQYKPYDNFEAKSGFYRFGAKKLLAKVLPLLDPRAKHRILDAGCGTGNSMLEILKAFPQSHVLGVDSSAPMLELARMKFGGEGHAELIRELAYSGDKAHAAYMESFVNEVLPMNPYRFEFRLADLMGLVRPPFDAVIGAQVLHWLKSEEDAAAKFAELTRKGGVLALSSSMSFYQPQKYNQDDVSYLRHPFTLEYLEVLSRIIERESGKSVRAPEPKEKKHPLATIAVFRSAGFSLHEYDEIPLPKLGIELLLGYNLKAVPAHLGMFEGTGLDEPAQTMLISMAIGEMMSRRSHLLPNSGIPSDNCPMFVFVRD